jgi:hypothetical protein
MWRDSDAFILKGFGNWPVSTVERKALLVDFNLSHAFRGHQLFLFVNPARHSSRDSDAKQAPCPRRGLVYGWRVYPAVPRAMPIGLLNLHRPKIVTLRPAANSLNSPNP